MEPFPKRKFIFFSCSLRRAVVFSAHSTQEWRTRMKRSDVKRFCLTVALVLTAAYIAAAPPGTYHLIKKIPLGAAPGGTEYFDYITFDPSTRRVYLSHGTEV